MEKTNQYGVVQIIPLFLIIAVVGVIFYLLVSSTVPFNGVFSSLFPKSLSKASTQPNVVPMQVISRGVPAFASSGTASAANNSNYDDQWAASSPQAWLAYDLSSVQASHRGRVVVDFIPQSVWADPNDSPQNYTIEGNAAVGGGSAPSSGWQTLITVTGNTWLFNERVVNMTGYNWIRLNVSSTIHGNNVGFNMDVHDGSQGISDIWFFQGNLMFTPLGNYDGNLGLSFPELVHASLPDFFPMEESLNSDGPLVKDCNSNIKSWMTAAPDAKFVGLSFGSVEAQGYSGGLFYDYYKSCVNQLMATGKYAAIPKIPYGTRFLPGIQGLNAVIDELYQDVPQIVQGPDFYTLFSSDPATYAPDGYHLSTIGNQTIRTEWAKKMVNDIYNGPSLPALPTMNPAPSGSVSQYGGINDLYTDVHNTVWTPNNLEAFMYDDRIVGAEDSALYRHHIHRNTPFSFSIPNGQYQVTLKFSEDEVTGSGQRVMNVNINGTRVLTNFDIFAEVGAHHALDKTFPVTVTNGSITVDISNTVGIPNISAIQAVPASAVTPTPVSTPTQSATPNPVTQNFTCTEVLGFAQTYQWWYGGPNFSEFSTVYGSPTWQLRFDNAWGWILIDTWAVTPPGNVYQMALNGTHCAQNSASPDRVVLTISSNYNSDVNYWKTNIQGAINNIRSVYPNVAQIALQPEVGGPNGQPCPHALTSGEVLQPYVRSTYNFPYINQAISQLVGGIVVAGAKPTVTSCTDFGTDYAGNISDATVRGNLEQQIATFYKTGTQPPVVTPTPGGTVTPTPTPTRTSTPTPTPTGTPIPGTTTVTFDGGPSQGALSGQYPTGLINWSASNWIVSGPFSVFATNSISFPSATPTSGTFSFVSSARLISLQAANGGSGASTVTIACSGNQTVSQTVPVNQLTTITTNWTNPCTGAVTITSSNGWNTNFDNLVVATGSSTTPTPTPAPMQGDLDGDNHVTIFDYNILVGNFGKTGTGIQGDIDGNGKVDIFDYNILVGNFGK